MIFVDTSFCVAIRNRRGANHEQATQLRRENAGAASFTSGGITPGFNTNEAARNARGGRVDGFSWRRAFALKSARSYIG